VLAGEVRCGQSAHRGLHLPVTLHLCCSASAMEADPPRPHSQFRQALVELAEKEDPSNGVVATLEKVCALYGLWSIEEQAGYFLKYKVSSLLPLSPSPTSRSHFSWTLRSSTRQSRWISSPPK